MEKKNLKFSVIIPAYKRTYLKECIESILTQTYSNFELIIVNDASPEDLDSVVLSYDTTRIRYYTNEKNCGAVDVVDNWNICLSYVTGDYVICMGDDDKLMPNCLEEYAKLIYKYPGLGLYHARTEIIDENSQFKDLQDARCEYESVYSLMWHRWDNRIRQYIGDFLFDVEILRANGGFYKLPLAWASDELSAYIAASSSGVANSKDILFQYRESNETITSTGNIEYKFKAWTLEEEWVDKFLEEKPTNSLDLKYWQLILQIKRKHFQKEKIYALAREFKWKSFFYYLILARRNSLTFAMFLYSIILYYKGKRL